MVRLFLASAVVTAALVAGCASLLGVTPLTEDDAGPAGESGATGSDGGPDAARGADGTSADAAEAADAMVAADATSGCSAVWTDGAAGTVPTGAIPSEPPGEAGIAIYVCRTPSGSDMVPGKLLPGWGCYYGDGSAEVLTRAGYEVLVASGCTIAWQPSRAGIVPTYAFPCGQDSQGVLYSCRVQEPDGGVGEGELGHMGWGTNHQCVYDYSGQSLSAVVFDVLTLH
jgi:hypothetical protein